MNEFSICIPNFNYENFLGITLQSVVEQSYTRFNVLISDNASTDRSIEVIEKFAQNDARILFKVNKSNVGFAGNLDECGRMADKNWMIMLSSDDVMTENALQEYERFITLIPEGQQFAFSSTFDKIDANGNHISIIEASKSIWYDTDIDSLLTERMGCKIYKVPSNIMLKRCLETFYNPFNFAATCFLRNSYEKVNGYGGGRVYNPDKWFHWKLLTVTECVYFIDRPLFQYRWHQQNQQAIQKEADVLKFWYDEYRNCFEVDTLMLHKSGLTRPELVDLYTMHLMKYILADLKNANVQSAKRLLNWGRACYPSAFTKNKYYFVLNFLSKLGVLGSGAIRLILAFRK